MCRSGEASKQSDNDDYRALKNLSEFSRHAGLAANPPEAFEGANFR
jgi:hypothetical protein